MVVDCFLLEDRKLTVCPESLFVQKIAFLRK